MVPYTRLRNSTCACTTTANKYYDNTDTSATGDDDCNCGYYEVYSTSSRDEQLFVIPKEKTIFNRNKISNVNIKLKQRILPVRQQMRFTTRNAL